jgi:catechol 2,3-dioxygenase-like lactoylglutathione lyase family enzyme
MFGRFLEFSIATRDIAASVQFYERLGFVQLTTSDTWAHRYGVLGDGRIHIGLHERPIDSTLAFVRPGLRDARAGLAAAGFEAVSERFGEEELHRMQLRDPGGQAVTLLEARTYSPAAPDGAESLCGWFQHLSLPQADPERAREFWERGGFVALEAAETPYPHTPLTSDRLDLAFHSPRLCDAPLLVFDAGDWVARRARLETAGIALSPELPRGARRKEGGIIEAPEGTLLWLLGSL